LLIYHAWMIFLFTTQANENNFYIPLFLQGFGVGTLMTPSIIFMVASVPEHLSVTSAGLCLFMRCMGFYVSIGLLNFFELFSKSKHFNTFQNQVTKISPVVNKTVSTLQHNLMHHGALPGKAAKSANKLLVNSINAQGHIRYAIDYYEMISAMIIIVLLIVTLFPYLNRTALGLTKNQPSPF
jgi:DHA2 family multidrug resistance protein